MQGVARLLVSATATTATAAAASDASHRAVLVAAAWRRHYSSSSSSNDANANSPPPPLLPWAQLMQSAITPSVGAQLKADGFAIVDGALPPEACAALRAEIDALRAAPGLTRPNHTFFVPPGGSGGSAKPQLVPKRAIVEAEISHDPAARAAAPLLAHIDADPTLATLLSRYLPPLRLSSGAGGSQGIKAQFNGGGGAFPVHTDSEDGVDARAVTAVFYLNPGWRPAHGGELRLYPFPQRAPVDVAPLEGRLALFSSKQMHHRVLPAAVPRYCFTVWLSEASGPGGAAAAAAAAAAARPKPPAPVSDGGAGDKDAAAAVYRFLIHPAVRRHVVRIAYAGEWAQSLADAHAPGAGADATAAQHVSAATAAARALAPYVAQIRALADAAASTPGGAEGAGLLPPRSVKWF